jgi:hypothetical protein
MKKISYVNKLPSKTKPYSGAIPEPVDQYHSNGGGIGRGLVMPGESSIPMENEEEGVFMKDDIGKAAPVNHDELRDLLIDMSDLLDRSGEYKLASFSDFLIKKIAESNSEDYDKLLTQLVVKISDSDIPNRNGTIITIVKAYNNKYIRLLASGASSAESKREAYQVAAEGFERYVR